VPRDISIIGFDDIIWGTATHPRLTTVHVDKQLMGHLAMERVLSALGGGSHTVTSTTIAAELLLRESTAPPHSTTECGEVIGTGHYQSKSVT
jgi:DNA-binding LacI/PurR family transcriptional regulator